MVIPNTVVGAGEERLGTYALLDGGSTRHVVSSELCERLGIQGEKIKMSVTTLDRVVEGEREVADVTIQGTNGLQVKLGSAIFGQIIASRGDSPPRREDIAGMEYLEGVEFPQFAEGERVERKIGVIIGAEHAWIWTMGERRMGGRDSAVGIKTALGWGCWAPRGQMPLSLRVVALLRFRAEWMT